MQKRLFAFTFMAVSLLGTATHIGSADSGTFRATVEVSVTVNPTVVCRVLVTAYNSEVGQTDTTPFLTASQTPTRWGVAAARWMPAGTRLFVPGHFGGEPFVVEDMMPVKNWCKLDVWHQKEAGANEFGKRFLDILIVDPSPGFTCPTQPSGTQFKCPEPDTAWDRKAAQPRCPSYLDGCHRDAEPVRVAQSQ